MRALRVVGLTGDGSVVLEDPGRRERYTVPADEQLRAAARGDVTRLGQIAIELESQLRPREIQARIRGGASVAEVAEAAGVPVQKIERFAYPVLLERSRTAELAQGAHPQRADGPDLRTLGETVAHTFGLRGLEYHDAGWDSWKGDDGKWVVALSWRAGRSDNVALWAFQPGAHGGTVAALDEHASDLVEGLPARPLRTVGPVIDISRDEDPGTGEPESSQVRAAAAGETRTADSRRGIAPEQRRASPTPPRASASTTATPAPAAPASQPPAQPPAAQPPAAQPAPSQPAASEPPSPQPSPTQNGSQAPAASQPASPASPAEPASASPAATADHAGATHAGATHGGVAPYGSASDGPASTGSGEITPDESGAARTTAAHPADDTATESSATDRDAPAADAGTRRVDTGNGQADTGTRQADVVDEPDRTDVTDGEPSSAADADESRSRAPSSGNRGGAANRRTKKGKPVMPSWDEVLLGVRGQR